MSREAETGPLEVPDELEESLGEVRETEEQCPGIWYVCTQGDGREKGTEFYVVNRDTDIISTEAKAYGVEIPECPQYLLYPMDQEQQVRRIIEYEVQMHRIQNHSPLADKNALLEAALYGAEDFPEYFEPYPAPPETPFGRTTRYKTLINGVFWLETDECQRALALAWPLWPDSFSRYTMRLARYESADKAENDVGYLFFPEQAIPLALFELRRTYSQMRSCDKINVEALMNVIYRDFPDYAVMFNSMEQAGGDSPLGRSFTDGESAKSSVGHMLRITLEAGTEFLRF